MSKEPSKSSDVLERALLREFVVRSLPSRTLGRKSVTAPHLQNHRYEVCVFATLPVEKPLREAREGPKKKWRAMETVPLLEEYASLQERERS